MNTLKMSNIFTIMKVQVQVKIRSRKEGVEVLEDQMLLVRVSEPPVDGKANKRIIELLAEHFGVPKSSVKLDRGGKSKIKVFEIEGL